MYVIWILTLDDGGIASLITARPRHHAATGTRQCSTRASMHRCDKYGYLTWLLGKPANEGMAVSASAGAFIKVLDDDSLLASVPPLQDDDDLSRLHKKQGDVSNFASRGPVPEWPSPE
jgi:hypothetical protein